ncbi:MAG: transcription antitermination factor NusB [Planctomycetaceae bacterium]|nr:transcription antitermination factor NusB [Planctomycetaceae bacterium]
MAKRSRARQVTVQMLFQVDLNPDVDGRMVRGMIADRLSDEVLKEFSWELFLGVMEHRAELDEQIQQAAENWSLSRMAATDRAIIRLGAYELMKTSVPVNVVIDEAIELAKKFGSSQSSQFVNGVLDKLVPLERRGVGFRRPKPQ